MCRLTTGEPGLLGGVVPDRYPAIEDHAVVGDLHTVALVATDGTTDWCCAALAALLMYPGPLLVRCWSTSRPERSSRHQPRRGRNPSAAPGTGAVGRVAATM